MEPISYAESLKILQQLGQGLHSVIETIPVREGVSRVLSAPVTARYANPRDAVAAMDGIAVNCTTIPDALVRLRGDQWRFINTGELLPEPFNAVIKIEDVQWEEKIPVLNRKPDLYQNVRRPGEDFEQGSLLLTSEHQLQPQDISLLITSGCNEVDVYKKPVISFIPTGSELVNAQTADQKGKIIESNSAMIAGLVNSWGGQFRLMDPVPDEADDLAQMIKLCVQQSDIIVISAGTSKGTKDLTAEVIRLMGKILFHGVRMTPGKPVLLGDVNGVPVLGLPGYPSAAYFCSYLYLRRLLARLSHLSVALPQKVFISSEDISPRPMDAFYRVNCFDVDGQIFVRKIEGGASSIASVSRMDGFMHVPPQTAIRKRDGVRIDVIHDRAQNTVTVRGISDPALLYLLGLAGRDLPSQRLLFWDAAGEDALQTIVERSLHVATIGVPAQGPDPFDSFARQLQEPMHRYRALTRTAALIFREGAPQELVKGLKVAVPNSHNLLWNHFLDGQSLNPGSFQIITPDVNDQSLLDAFPSSKWEAVLADVRYLRSQDLSPAFTIREHVDIVIPDSFVDLPGVRKLIDLLLSEEFSMFVETQKGCDLEQRGEL